MSKSNDNISPNRYTASDVAAELRQRITNGVLLSNDRLPPERNLAAEFDVARGTIRKALGQLETEQLLEIRAGSGTYVTFEPGATQSAPVANATPLELIDARFAVEPHVCRLAVLHGRRRDFELLDDLCSQMEASTNDPARFATADAEFHRALSGCTGNGLLIWFIEQITSARANVEWTKMRQLTLNDYVIEKYNAQHRSILDAIRTREPERAANTMKKHLETARLTLTRAAAT